MNYGFWNIKEWQIFKTLCSKANMSSLGLSQALGHHFKTFGFNSPVVQCLGLPALTAEGLDSIPCQGTTISQAVWFLFQSIVLHLCHSLKSPVKAPLPNSVKIILKKRSIIALQCCVPFFCTKWLNYMYAYIPFLLSLPSSAPAPRLPPPTRSSKGTGLSPVKVFFFKEKYQSGVERWCGIVLKASRHSDMLEHPRFECPISNADLILHAINICCVYMCPVLWRRGKVKPLHILLLLLSL